MVVKIGLLEPKTDEEKQVLRYKRTKRHLQVEGLRFANYDPTRHTEPILKFRRMYEEFILNFNAMRIAYLDNNFEKVDEYFDLCALSIRKLIKHSFSELRVYISREDFPDGLTETLTFYRKHFGDICDFGPDGRWVTRCTGRYSVYLTNLTEAGMFDLVYDLCCHVYKYSDKRIEQLLEAKVTFTDYIGQTDNEELIQDGKVKKTIDNYLKECLQVERKK